MSIGPTPVSRAVLMSKSLPRGLTVVKSPIPRQPQHLLECNRASPSAEPDSIAPGRPITGDPSDGPPAVSVCLGFPPTAGDVGRHPGNLDPRPGGAIRPVTLSPGKPYLPPPFPAARGSASLLSGG